MSSEKITKAILTQDGQAMIEGPDGRYCPADSKTNWERVRAMTDDEITAAAASDPDAQPLDETFWHTAKVVKPPMEKQKPSDVIA